MKVIDFEDIFYQQVQQHMKEHAGEFTEKELEEWTIAAYQQFIQNYLAEIQTSPIAFFETKTIVELINLLKAYVQNAVQVPELLLENIEKFGYCQEIANLLVEDNQKLQLYAIEFLQADKRIIQSYFYILKNERYTDIVKAKIVEKLSKIADKLILPLFKLAKTKAREYAIELLVISGQKSEEIFALLLKAYREENQNKIFYLKMLGAYGDEAALPILYKDIQSEEIGYLLFKEMKYTIERFGGSYDIIRNFSFDADYQAIQLANLREEKMRQAEQTLGAGYKDD